VFHHRRGHIYSFRKVITLALRIVNRYAEAVTSHLVGAAEIALMLGVSRPRVYQLMDSYEDFPEPEVDLASGRVWRRARIEQWMKRHPSRPPGRPTRT